MTSIPLALRKPLARDGAWLVGSAVIARIFGTIAQVIMGILLARDDYLVWGIAISFISILGSAKDGGAGKLILQGVNRSESEVRRAAIYGYRVVALSVVGASLIAPVVGWFYGSTKVAGLVAVGAISIAVNGLGMLPKARLTVAGHYATVSRIAMLASLSATTSMVACALFGLGAFSFPIALSIGGFVRFVGMSRVANRVVAFPATVEQEINVTSHVERRWLLASTIATALVMNVDYMILGALAPEILAAYFFGFQLTLTLSTLVAPAMEQTLLPYFSRIGGKASREVSLHKMILLTTMVVTPIGLVACVLSPSLVRLLWGDKWLDATPVIQVFSVGVGVRLLLPILVTHLQAQRRWKRVAIFYWLDAALVMVVTAATSHLGLLTVATAVTAARSMTIFSLLLMVLRTRYGAIDVAQTLAPFVVLALIAVWAVSNETLLIAWGFETSAGVGFSSLALGATLLTTSWASFRRHLVTSS